MRDLSMLHESNAEDWMLFWMNSIMISLIFRTPVWWRRESSWFRWR